MDIVIREQLNQLADPSYRDFQSALCPGVERMIGVRLPEIKKIAKEISKQDNWREQLLQMNHSNPNEMLYEELMLEGLLIGFVKTDFEDRLGFVEVFVPKINNWAVCDSFCMGLKSVSKHVERMWEFLQFYLFADEEFMQRFAVVCLLSFYVVPEYIERVLHVLNGIRHDGYYVRMAVAWAVSVCFVKFPEQTMEYLKNSTLDTFTFNKSLQKIVESQRVDAQTKEVIRGMKRKGSAVPPSLQA